MRLHRKKPSINRGSALVVTLFSCAILGTLVGSYLYLTGTQNISVTRSQNWHQALVVAEAGVDEALALMNSGVQSNNFARLPWSSVGAGSGAYKHATNRPGCKFGTSYYEATITNAFLDANPVIISKGYVNGPVSSPRLYRVLRVETKPRLTFPVKGPMIVVQGFDANGSNVGTDSFDSSVGPYNPSVPSTNGDVITLSTAPNSIAIGNATIRGNVRTPPGGTLGAGGTVTILGGKVGDSAWISGGTSGVQPGHFQPNFTLADFPDAALPNVTVWALPMSGTAPDGLIYDRLLISGNYKVDNLTGSVYVGQTNTVLWVTTSINISGGGVPAGYADPQIHIGPGASLTIYMSGATTSINGNGLVNDSAKASTFAYYGLPSNTTINLTGNGAFYGTIYAPSADFNLKGSGKGSYDDFTGASVTKSTTMTGNFKFHYDEDLIHLTTLGGYDVTSWAEL